MSCETDISSKYVYWAGNCLLVGTVGGCPHYQHQPPFRVQIVAVVLSRVRSLHTSEVIAGVSAVFTSHCVSPPSLPPLPLPTWHCAYCRGNVNVYIFTLSTLGCLVRDLMDYLHLHLSTFYVSTSFTTSTYSTSTYYILYFSANNESYKS